MTDATVCGVPLSTLEVVNGVVLHVYALMLEFHTKPFEEMGSNSRSACKDTRRHTIAS